MKVYLLKFAFFLILFTAFVINVDAQRKPRKRPVDTTSTQQPVTQQQQQNNNNAQPSKYNPFGNIPIEVAPTTGGGLNDTIRKSMRNDGAYDKNMVQDRTPLPYENLRWDDALFSERVWREIDIREKINMPFRYKADDDNGDQRFIAILLNAVRKGQVTAFDANVDDRFTTPLSLDQVNAQLSGGQADTIAVYGDFKDPTKITKYSVVQKEFDMDAVLKYRIKEDWVFDREASRMFTRIIGVAPLKMIYNENGTERGPTPLFWVYYPDLRPILAKFEVYNSKNMGNSRMTWEELFESRMFGSYITKSTFDNPLNKNIRTYIKDPILALLEGDAIKEKIFNYEQDLWSY